MNKYLGILGNLSALAGILACVVAGVARLLGKFYVGGLEAMVMFTVGVGLMVFACLVKLCVLESKT
jgi:hypothetical protein